MRLYDSGGKSAEHTATRLLSGVVVNDCELLPQGNVLVRVPALDQEMWARLVAAGGGPGAGFFFQPRIGDEVLIGVTGAEAFVLGGMYSPVNGPPVSNTVDAKTKRIIKSGLGGGVGHRIELDDARQSMSIHCVTGHEITVGPAEIALTNPAGSLTITLRDADQTIVISGVNIELSAKAKLTLSGGLIDITAKGPLVQQGKPIKIN
ncbi:phage baseplate assembly protein V [Nonomuraea sp. NPDC050643]|uniref:phage baseplate assembly protein V n=1 Tax=Nonomuraea sp. NPDC050643 TaxID=3155660 RepID=UPI0033F01589